MDRSTRLKQIALRKEKTLRNKFQNDEFKANICRSELLYTGGFRVGRPCQLQVMLPALEKKKISPEQYTI